MMKKTKGRMKVTVRRTSKKDSKRDFEKEEKCNIAGEVVGDKIALVSLGFAHRQSSNFESVEANIHVTLPVVLEDNYRADAPFDTYPITNALEAMEKVIGEKLTELSKELAELLD